MGIVHHILKSFEATSGVAGLVACRVACIVQSVEVIGFVAVIVPVEIHCPGCGDGVLDGLIGESNLDVVDSGERDGHGDLAIGAGAGTAEDVVLWVEQVGDTAAPSTLEGFIGQGALPLVLLVGMREELRGQRDGIVCGAIGGFDDATHVGAEGEVWGRVTVWAGVIGSEDGGDLRHGGVEFEICFIGTAGSVRVGNGDGFRGREGEDPAVVVVVVSC